MSIVTTREYWTPTSVSSLPTVVAGAGLDIANLNEKIAIVFIAPETKLIEGVHFKLASAVTGGTIQVRLEQVDTATGEPNGVLISSTPGRESRTFADTVSGAGNYTQDFPVDEVDGAFELTQGTLCALVFVVISGTPTGITFNTFNDDNPAATIPYCIDYDGATSTQTAIFRDNLAPCVGLLAQGGYPIKHFWPFSSVGLDTFQATSTPDTIGNRIQILAPVRISGIRVWVDADSTATVKLYDKNGSTVLASANIYPNVPPSTTAHIADYYFSAPIDLTVGYYYIAVEATGTTIGIGTMTFVSVTSAGFPNASSPLGGISMTFASCTQPPTSTASWTLTESKQAFITPIFSGSELGGSAGGGETSHVFAS